MRDILFRGKRKDDHEGDETNRGKWIYGDLMGFRRDTSIINEYAYLEPGVLANVIDVVPETVGQLTGAINVIDVIPETVGQFAGLFDKNGKKIFEDDIVKTKYGRLCVVTWFVSREHNGWDLIAVGTYENVLHKEPDLFDLFASENLEVVGNIHDNPEMLR